MSSINCHITKQKITTGIDYIPSLSLMEQKIARIRNGAQPRVLDLFSGCGGISLGFHRAGFSIEAAIELDPVAALSHAVNFHKESTKFREHSLPRDITKIEPEGLISDLGLEGSISNSIDVLVGGPPCQAFARVGRAKLREVADHPDAFKLDPRGNLYLRYIHFIKELRPLAILIENVPDVINYGGHNIPQEICEVLDEIGYRCSYTLLNAAFYGVPQMRERMFLIAYANELASNIIFPKPTNWINLPKGYESSRQVALRMLSPNLFNQNQETYFQSAPEPVPDLPPAVTAFEALGDLPRLTDHLEGKSKKGARRFDKVLIYPSHIPPSNFANDMRNWPGFQNNVGVSDHVIRFLPRDYALFARMNPGDQYPQAYQHAINMFNEELARIKNTGQEIVYDSLEYNTIKSRIVPPYDATKFPNKWRKMEADQPSRTLMAHLGKDSYSHIHYDSTQARTISVREAARLQSFPDGFIFQGTMNPAFRQIGNAVPPLLAYTIAKEIFSTLKGA